ncbi:MAG: TetR/AcrR family transcriptional regulator [Candidatus Saccharibacteria bacterium]|nr:TetR/AcrR family transcriptional regulator [Moraxellaceae bacterium]
MLNTLTTQLTTDDALEPAINKRHLAKQLSRTAILNSAEILFGLHGLDGSSLDDICTHAGYTRGAFYGHFKDRDDLIAAVMAHMRYKTLDALALDSPDEDIPTLIMRFIAGISSGVYPFTRHGGIRPYQLLDACARSPAIQAEYVESINQSFKRLDVIIKGNQARQQLREDISAESLSRLFVAMVIGIHTLYDLEVPLDLMGDMKTLFKMVSPN